MCNENLDIEKLINEERVITVFQPIISIKRKGITGFEALSRGIDERGEIIAPDKMFLEAARKGLNLEIDRLCRRKALENFREIFIAHPQALLFMNFDVSVLNSDIVGSDFIMKIVVENGIPPENIVIEFLESKITDFAAVELFVETYRKRGFLMAVDDVGAGYSNLDRFFMMKPDIVKIDRTIVMGIDNSYYKQEVFKSLVSLSKKIGALVVSEGIETEQEALMSLELGADFLQGFYLCRPNKNEFVNAAGNIETVSTMFKLHMISHIKGKRARAKFYEKILKDISEVLIKHELLEYDFLLNKYIGCYDFIECMYVLDESGIQINETVFSSEKHLKSGSHLFKPAAKGEDHGLKEYFYFIKDTGMSKFYTEPYISMASGNKCMTISYLFILDNGKRYILCIDILVDCITV